MSAPTVTVRDKGRLFDWKLLLGFLGVGVLLTLSLFTGVFDIFGG
ncbi:ABC transporter permease, partial [Rhodococcus hoagii]|nr:ABC transporter permease [Prescottella equi]